MQPDTDPVLATIHAAVELEALNSEAWLSHRLTAYDAQAGTLSFIDGRFSFITNEGQLQFELQIADIKQVDFSYGGWIFITTKSSEIYKVAFFDPQPNSATRLAERVARARPIAVQWQKILQTYVPTIGDASKMSFGWKKLVKLAAILATAFVFVAVIALIIHWTND